MSSTDFAAELEKVRRLTGSQLAHQSKPAQLLVAIESTITSTLNAPPPHSSTAYFASLLQCLEKACADEVGDDEDMAETENMGQGALIPATLYLLAIVVPETPNQVVLSKLSPLLECILPLYDSALEHPPALRSLLQITTAVVLLAPPPLLTSSPLLKKAWNYLLELNLDPRPKVRHLTQEGVRKVLTTPIPPKVVAGQHPYLARAREWVMNVLEEEVKAGGAKGKKARFADAEDMEGKKAIWVVQGLRGWVAVWGDDVSILSSYSQFCLTKRSNCRRLALHSSLSLPSPTSHLKSILFLPCSCLLLHRTLPHPTPLFLLTSLPSLTHCFLLPLRPAICPPIFQPSLELSSKCPFKIPLP